MNIQKIVAFSDGSIGGNPAGVVIVDSLPTENEMQRTAKEIGFSETVFSAPLGKEWRVRYYSSESEVPFCGHATIALGAALSLRFGDGVFTLVLNHSKITVEGHRYGAEVEAALQSPMTFSKPLDHDLIADALQLLGYTSNDLDSRIPPALIHAGADHLVLALSDRHTLSAMKYDFIQGRAFMLKAGLTTIMLVHAETFQLFHARNAFAIGGVYEDPATGAAAAAFAGYLGEIAWPYGNSIEIIQGEDMGMKSRLRAEISNVKGSSIRVSGRARII